MDADELDWNRTLREQWEFHWNHQLRARLDGLTDDEYFWSPVPDAWSVRPRGSSTAPVQVGAGDFTIDYAFPEPVPAAFTTIAWRLGHVVVGVLAPAHGAAVRPPGGVVRALGVRRQRARRARPARGPARRLAGRGAQPRRGRAP